MPGVLFFFEENDIDIFSGRKIDLSAWNYAIKSVGDIDNVIVVNRTSRPLSTIDSSINFQTVDSFPSLVGTKTFIICPHDQAKVKSNLWDFDHKTDWYIFGPAAGWKKEKVEIENGIFVPTALDDGLHALHIATTVMLHRFKVISWQPQ